MRQLNYIIMWWSKQSEQAIPCNQYVDIYTIFFSLYAYFYLTGASRGAKAQASAKYSTFPALCLSFLL